jgi:hypothetical protein
MKPPPPSKRPRALRYATGRTLRVVNRTDTAAEVIGPLAPGVRVTGLTAGQFSAIDAMEHMVDQLGPGCAVRISTWTSGLYDVRRAAEIRIDGRISDIRMLLDRGTFEKSPKYAGPLIEALGVEAFRYLSVHAKVIIVAGARGAAVMSPFHFFDVILKTGDHQRRKKSAKTNGWPRDGGSDDHMVQRP